MFMPTHAGAGAEGLGDAGNRGERAQGQLECPGQISRAVFIGRGEGLFLAQAEGARFLVVVDVAAGCLGSQPFAQVALVGSCLGGELGGSDGATGEGFVKPQLLPDDHHAGMVVIGEKLGLYKALARGPVTPAELAAQTRTDERYLREWLASQAAGGYINYDEKTGTFSLGQEQAFAPANEDSPAYLPGAFELALGSLAAVPRIAESFRTGAGMGWHEHVDGVFHGCEKFFRPGYAANLVSSWIPALHDEIGRAHV